MEKSVCVIGAGPSGITALKNIQDKGIKVIAYDYNHDVGGNWIYSEKESHSSVFETTHIISSKTLSQYEDFPFPQEVADYPSHEELRNYFQAYAKAFSLYPLIRFNTLVQSCVFNPENIWEVTTVCEGIEKTEKFTDLVVCNGHHWQPKYPNYPGKFSGEFLHSHQFKKAAPFRDKRVLVIGGGNSACDVAVETSRVSKKTSISWRRGYRILPKFIMGKPSDVFASSMTFLPIWLRNFFAGIMVKIATGPNSWYGLPNVNHKFGATHPTVNSELLYMIRHGKVKPKPDIERFDGATVYFKDGSKEDFDSVIACTGFVLSHPFFKKDFLNYSSGPVPLYLKMFHPEMANLYFIGMFQPLGCIWPGAEQQGKLAASALSGEWQRPQNIAQLCEREVSQPHMKQLATSRHTITVDFHKFLRQIKAELRKAKPIKKVA
ncbi:MAG: NAD(P)-binding domain-containing protein [Candidatus Arcticimaribacter sp.]